MSKFREPTNNGRWTFTRWDLVDLSHFNLRLKSEFQASNRDIYKPEAILSTSEKQLPPMAAFNPFEFTTRSLRGGKAVSKTGQPLTLIQHAKSQGKLSDILFC